MNKNAVLGALATAMVSVIAYLLYSSGAIGNKGNNYTPYVQNGYYNQGQMQPVPQMQPAPQVAQAQPVQQAQPAPQAQPQKQAAPKKPKSSPPPAAPAQALLNTQTMDDLIRLLNNFGNPSGPDQIMNCYIQVQQNNNGTSTDLAIVNEKCIVTPYGTQSAVILSRTNGEPFFNMFGGAYSLIRIDNAYPDINLYQPKAPGLWFGSNVGPGPTPACTVADNSVPGAGNPIRITVCYQ